MSKQRPNKQTSYAQAINYQTINQTLMKQTNEQTNNVASTGGTQSTGTARSREHKEAKQRNIEDKEHTENKGNKPGINEETKKQRSTERNNKQLYYMNTEITQERHKRTKKPRNAETQK